MKISYKNKGVTRSAPKVNKRGEARRRRERRTRKGEEREGKGRGELEEEEKKGKGREEEKEKTEEEKEGKGEERSLGEENPHSSYLTPCASPSVMRTTSRDRRFRKSAGTRTDTPAAPPSQPGICGRRGRR